MKFSVLSFALVLAAAPFCASGEEGKAEMIPQRASELFQTAKVWTAHFTFTPEQWVAMEPKGGARPPGGFGPGMFLAPAFVKAGDSNHDGKLSAEEFRALGSNWFAAWDKEGRGSVNADQLKAGLNTTFAPPNPDRPPDGALPPGPRPGPPGLQGAEGKRNGLSSAAGIEFEFAKGDLDFAGRHFKDVAVRYKGNGTFMQSRGSEKRSFKVDLNKFEKGQKIATVTSLNLHSCVTDVSWMNEVLSYRLYRDAGVPSPRTAYARVFVTVPGKYDQKFFGFYSLVENPDKEFADELFGTRKGAIFKPVTPQLFADLGDEWKAYKQPYDPKTDLSSGEKQRVIDFAKLVSHATDEEFAAKLGDFLDLDEFARYMAVTVWLSTLDSILGAGQNYYVYLHPKTDKFQFLPWDLDHSFGHFFLMGNQEQRENLSIHKPWQGENRFLDRVFKVEAFKKRYLAVLEEFSRTIFQPERFAQQVEEVAAAIRPSVAEESPEKLAGFEKEVAGQPASFAAFGGGFPPRGGNNPPGAPPLGGPAPNPPGPGGPMGFPGAPKPIKTFVTARAQSVLDQLAGKSEGQKVGAFGPPGGGRPGAFKPGDFLWRPFMAALDTDKNGELSAQECEQCFAKWFDSWNSDRSGSLTDEQLRDGLNRDLFTFRGGPPGPQP